MASNKYVLALGTSPSILIDRILDQNYGYLFTNKAKLLHRFDKVNGCFRLSTIESAEEDGLYQLHLEVDKMMRLLKERVHY